MKAVSDANIVYPSCAVTRAMAKRTQSNIGHDSEFTGSTESAILDEGSTDNVNEIESQVELANTILSHGRELEKACHKPEKANACGEPFEVVNREQLIDLQDNDDDLATIREQVTSELAITVRWEF